MAKVGQEDPRWIVTEREDGTNVGNWHWQEKDAMRWLKEEAQKRFSDISVDMPEEGEFLKVTKLASVTGEAYWNNRKGRVFAIYELEVKLDWEGKVKDSEGELKKGSGSVNLSNISFENDVDDFDITISISGSEDSYKRSLKDKMFKEGRPLVRKAMAGLLNDLRSGGMWRLPSTSSLDSLDSPTTPVTPIEDSATSSAAKAPAKKPVALKNVELIEKFKARPSDIFECMVDQGRVSAFTASPAKIEARVGGSFTLFDGAIQGEYLEIEAPRKLVMTWRSRDWEDGIVSKVNIELREDSPGETVLSLTQTGVPNLDRFGHDGMVARTKQGWKEHYFMRMKALFGFGGSFSFY